MQSIQNQLNSYREKGRRFRKWKKVVTALACIVVFCTVYALILPAITLEGSTYCGKKEHTHSDECYKEAVVSIEEKLVCTKEETAPHTHTDECYEVREVEVQVEETVEVPAQEEQSLEESEDPEAPETKTVTRTEIKEEKVLICGAEETEGHTHGDGCYEEVEVYGEKELDCEKEEHRHSKACYSNPDADVETEADWMKTFEDVTFTNDWVEDTLAIAKTQLGYNESNDNYIVLENGDTKGYSRYGDWYGNKYGDWCAMFVSFCLNYAKVEDFPLEAGCQNWIPKIKNLEEASKDANGVVQYNAWQEANDEYIPERGNIIFFNWDSASDSDHVGIVVGTTTDEDGKTMITTIEGNTSDTVRYKEYALENSTIIGYGILPDQGYYCEMTGHAHDEDCYNEADDVICELEEHIHTEECKEKKEVAMEEPENGIMTLAEAVVEEADSEDVVHEEGSVEGKYYHSPDYKYYEVSAQRLKQSDVMTFALIPSAEYSDSWTPSTAKWSAKTNANYLVAYCAECLVTVSNSGASYGSYDIDNSRFATTELRKKLAGIIAHSYPYITYEEMQAELEAAYKNGEIAVDISNCTESEYMAATQAALWQLLVPTMSFNEFAASDTFASEELKDITINTATNAGHLDSTLDAHCEAIRDWLLTQIVPDDLEVESYGYDVQMDEYDLYSLTVDGTFNRSIISGEIVSLQMVAGSQKTEAQALAAGEDTFTIELTGLTQKELLDAIVSLNVSGERMQAYYFENANYQDMISGQWESYDNDLSFQVTTDSTSVSVTKHWTEDIPKGTEVEVNLFANGEKVRETAVLNEKNNWTYTWEALSKYDILDEPIEYTIQETPLSGYYSTVNGTSGETGTVKVWEEAESFEPGEKYMLVSDIGGMASYYTSDNKQRITWTASYPEDVSKCTEGLIWEAKDAGDGKVYLYSEYVGGALGYLDILGDVYYRTIPYTEASRENWISFVFNDGILTGSYAGNENLDFSYIGTNRGTTAGCLRDYSGMTYSYAQEFTLYKLVEKEVPPAEHNFILTNTRVRDDIQLMDVSVTKQWAGRPDESYPESVTVQIMQNGREYDIPVVLSAENNWTAQWLQLPKTDNEGNEFIYTVEEAEIEGYTATQETVVGEDGNHKITLTNTWNPKKVTVQLHKVDFGNTKKFLSGAEFDLYLVTNGAEEEEFIPDTEGIKGILKESIAVTEEGTATLELDAGEAYYLVETRAPNGYNSLIEPIGFTVEKREKHIKLTLLNGEKWVEVTSGTDPVLMVKNSNGYLLPKVGGSGTTSYIMAGLLLMFSAVCLMYTKKKRRGPNI